MSLGHPDKIADYISQYLLDRYIERDSATRYAVEVQIKDLNVTLGGEVSSQHRFTDGEIVGFVRDAVNDIGYTTEYQQRWGAENTICGDGLAVNIHISQQSSDIAQGLAGWGDQGIFFGYADTDPKTNYMPKDHAYAKRLCKALFESGLGGLDIKTQVYLKDDDIAKIIVAIPLLEENTEKVEQFVRNIITGDYEIVVNGTGRYVKHSSIADCGTTGRKLVVDFYGGNCKIGGGSPWTKDGSKADLTLNLYAREIARMWARECEVPAIASIACCIGKPEIDVVVQNAITGEKIDTYNSSFVMNPAALIEHFRLNKPIFASMCRWGLFGEFQKDKEWEK